MPFGLCNAVSSFQRLADCVLSGMPCVFVYIDDVLIFSDSEEQHAQDVRAVLQRLREAGLSVNPDKSRFFQKEVEFLGHRITPAGVFPLPKRLDALTSFPSPTDRTSLLRFVGSLNFYRQFLPGAAGLLRPLTRLLKKDVEWEWGPDQVAAFEAARKAVSEASALAFYQSGAPLRLSVDASDVAIGAVLEQEQDGAYVPLGFFSRHYSPAEERYSTFDRELLACYSSVHYFRHLLEGNKFQLRSDHRPVC